MRTKRTPKPGWNDEMTDALPPVTPSQIQEQIDESAKELNETVGMGGSLGRVASGGVRLMTGAGLEAVSGGIRRTQIEPDGDLFAGADIDDPAGTSFAVFVVTQEYNTEEMEEGDILIGDNSADSSNVKWDASEGQLQFRLGETVQVYMDTDGSIKAGGGDVTIDQFGITFANQEGLLQFLDTDDGGTMALFADGDNFLVLENSFGGKGFTFNIDTAAHAVEVIEFTDSYADFYDALLRVDNADNRIEISDVAIFDNSAEKRLEIGSDHYIPTRDSSNPVTIFNEANQSAMDFNIQGQTDDNLFYADASTDRIGIGTNTPGVKLDVNNGTVRSKLLASLADDAATSFTPSTTVGGMIVMAATGAGNGGFAGYNTVTGTATAMMSGTNFAAANGVLAGTTGADTKLTVSAHTNGNIYIENRTGATRNVLILLI